MDKNQENMKKKSMSTKIVTSTSAGGLAGIILLGGALVTAALVSTFAFKVKQKFNKPSKVVKQDSEKNLGDKGLSFLVSDSLSSQSDHRPRNGTGSEFVSRETASLDESREVNGEKDEEFDVLEKASEGLLCDESVTGMEEIPVVADSSLLLKPDEMKNNDMLEENAVMKADERIMMADSDEAGVVVDDQYIPVEEDEVIDGDNELADQVDGIERMPAEKCNVTREVMIEREEVLVEVPRSEQLGIDYEYHKLGDECDGNGQILVEKREEVVEVAVVEKCNKTREVMIEREEVLVEVPRSEQLGIDYEYHKLGDVCDGNGQILVEKREEVVEVDAVDKIRADDDLNEGGEESDDDMGVTIEKGEVLVGDVAANQIQLSEKLESSTMYGDQDILCSDGTIMHRHETGSCDVKITYLLLPKMDSSSLMLKPAGKDHVENLLVIEETTILEEEEENETEDSIEVEESGQTHLVKANDENKICREITNDKSEDADEIGVENDQQMQPCEEYQKNLIDEDQKYISVESSPDNNSFQCNGCEEQEFSFPLLDSPPYFNFGNLIKNDCSETALHVDVKPLVQSAKNDEMKRFSDGTEIDPVKGGETLETGLVDIGQQTVSSEQYNFSHGSKIDEEVLEMIQSENFKLEKDQQLPLKEDSYYGDKDNREEDITGDFANEDEEENSGSNEEDSVDGSSETTGDSSMDSNAEAIWPVESVQEFTEEIVDSNNYMETKRADSNVNFNRRKLGEEDKDSFDRNFCNKFTAEITTLRQPTNFFSLKFLFLSLVVSFLLVLWLLSSQISSSGLSHSHLQ